MAKKKVPKNAKGNDFARKVDSLKLLFRRNVFNSMIEQNMTMLELEVRLDTSPEYLEDLLRCDTITLREMASIANALDVHVSDLLIEIETD